MGARFSSWAIPGSLAVTRGNPSEPEPGNFFEPSMRDDRTRRATEVSQPPIVVACVAEDLAFMPTARRGARGGHHPPPEGVDGGQRRVTPGRACPRPNGFGRNLRSKTRWFTGFCNSHQVSHFATFFIDARAEISVAESRFDIFEDDDATRAHRFRGDEDALSRSSSLAQFAPVFFSGRYARRGFDNDPSAGSPTETLLRLLLPLNDKVRWTSRDVVGSEPPTSPRSEHFTGPFNRLVEYIAFLSDVGSVRDKRTCGSSARRGHDDRTCRVKTLPIGRSEARRPHARSMLRIRDHKRETCGPSQSHDEPWVDRDTSTATTSSCCPRRARGGKGQREAPFLNNR
ncbi:unnamed protein product [Prunus brigantina]